jgi:hypothetical protein
MARWPAHQHINVFLDFFDAAPDLNPDLVFGAVDMDLVALANCTMLGMLMLYLANERLAYNGIRGLRCVGDLEELEHTQ